MEAKDRIWLPLDVSSLDQTGGLITSLATSIGCFKVGSQLFTRVGPPAVREILDRRGEVFLDLKWNDIPNTMAESAKAAADMGATYFNVMASASRKGIQAAVANKGNCKVLVVTVLTSFNRDDCFDIFGSYDIPDVVGDFARFAIDSGVDGIICSAQELEILKTIPFIEGKLLVTPGLRPKWAEANDHERVMTPGEAIKAGATALVIGRPITAPPPEVGSPLEAVRLITEEIEQALATS